MALQAEATSIPVAALLAGAGAAARPDVAVRQLVEALLQPRTITVGSMSVSLSLISQWVWTEGAMLVQFQFNPMLCRMLRELAAKRDIPPFQPIKLQGDKPPHQRVFDDIHARFELKFL